MPESRGRQIPLKRILPLLLFLFALAQASPVADQARSLLDQNCVTCHGANAVSGLDLRSRDSILKGGKRGPAAVPGEAEKSLLYQAAMQSSTLKMPPSKALAAQELAILRRWIDEGLPSAVNSSGRRHWAFEPVRKTLPPADPSGWAANP